MILLKRAGNYKRDPFLTLKFVQIVFGILRLEHWRQKKTLRITHFSLNLKPEEALYQQPAVRSTISQKEKWRDFSRPFEKNVIEIPSYNIFKLQKRKKYFHMPSTWHRFHDFIKNYENWKKYVLRSTFMTKSKKCWSEKVLIIT